MDFCFATFTTIVLLFAGASCAPAGQDACAALRTSSLELNQVAKNVSHELSSGSKADFTPFLVWMEARDMCDPATLRNTPEPCMGKILDALAKYRAAVETTNNIESCLRYTKRVKPKLENLHNDIRQCVRSKPKYSHIQEPHNSQEHSLPPTRQEKNLLCQYTMDRLFSFSILTARVFSLGDPANHPEGTPQTCM